MQWQLQAKAIKLGFYIGLMQLMSFCVGADDSLPENTLYKGLKLPLRAA